MKKLDYISPSGIARYKKSREEFYLKYLALDKMEDEPQSQPMAVGSAFDAYCKSYLHEKLFGKGNDPRFEFKAIFEAQVSPEQRDGALLAGKYCFDIYRSTGALTDLLLDLQKAVNTPRFEVDIKGVISGYREGALSEFHGITFYGKPDVTYINHSGMNIVLDFKVNGYYSTYKKSPVPGYVRLRGDVKNSKHHRDASLLMHGGMLINSAKHLEDVDDTWATQLTVYSWLTGGEVGGDFIAAIDQLCCSPSGTFIENSKVVKPDIRIAEHRLRIKPTYQHSVFALAQEIWTVSHSDHFFRDMTKEESQGRCQLLDQEAASLRGTGSQQDKDFIAITRER